MTEKSASLMGIFISAAASEPVHAPVPGSGMATKDEQAERLVFFNLRKLASALGFHAVNKLYKARVAHPVENLIDKEQNERRRQNGADEADQHGRQ